MNSIGSGTRFCNTRRASSPPCDYLKSMLVFHGVITPFMFLRRDPEI